jgi:hypothetical protein
MLENVAKDNKKIARRVLGVNAWDGGCECDFKASRLYFTQKYELHWQNHW